MKSEDLKQLTLQFEELNLLEAGAGNPLLNHLVQ